MISSHDKMEEKGTHVRPEFQEGGPCIDVQANLTNPYWKTADNTNCGF